MIGLFAAIAGCSEDPRSGIIGSWEGISLNQDFRFYQDGRAELIDRKHGIYRGTCTVSDEDLMTCNFERFAHPVVRTVRVRGDELVLANKNGQPEKYRRR